MVIHDLGVRRSSHMYFHEPTVFAKNALIYVPYCGIYECDSQYHISRDFLDTFLVLYVENGCMEVTYRNRSMLLSSGMLMVLDCKQPHSYHAVDSLKFRWFHFSGGSSQQFFDILYERFGMIDSRQVPVLDNHVDSIFSAMSKNSVDEYVVNMDMISILTALAKNSVGYKSTTEASIENALIYMEEHYRESISLDQISALISMSTCHFARLFKRIKNTSPHNYISSLRITEAKRLLLSSDITTEEIAATCGFNSTSHFIRAFGGRVGMTPYQFRKLTF